MTKTEQVTHVKMMATDYCGAWAFLSDEDRAALEAVTNDRAALLSALKATTKGMQMAIRSSLSRTLYDSDEHYAKAVDSNVVVAAALATIAKAEAHEVSSRASQITVNDFVCAVGEMTNTDALARVKHLVDVENAGRGIALIASERARQMAVEGWTAEHDDSHMEAEMIEGARAYLSAAVVTEIPRQWLGQPPPTWPWNQSWWKPSDDPIRNLVKAGALIAAEIDRLHRKSGLPIASDRAVQPEEQPHCENCGAVGLQLTELMCPHCWENGAMEPRFHWRDGWLFQRVDVGVLVTLPDRTQIVIPSDEWTSIVTHVSAASDRAVKEPGHEV